MARRKRSAALFEVIGRDRPVDRPVRTGGVGSWFSSNKSPSAPMPATAPMSSSMATPSVVSVAPLSAVTTSSAPLAPSTKLSARTIDLDEDRQEVAFRVSYTAAAIVIFTVATAVGGAFIAGRRLTGGVLNATAKNNVDPRLGPVQVDVTDLPRTPVSMPNSAAQAKAVPQNAGEPKQNSVPGVVNGRVRKAGYQYVVIQSYPDAKLADEARKVLAENGVESTVEQNLPGWSKWFCVMGTTGFERLSSNAHYDAYVRKIRQISATYAKRGSFKEFAPTAVKWDPKKR